MISGASEGHTAIWVKGCQTWARSACSSRSCRDEESMGPSLLERLEGAIHLRLGVRGGEGKAKPAGPLGNGGRTDGFGQDVALAEEGRGGHGPLRAADDDRDDGAARLGGEAQRPDAGDEALHVAEEPWTQLRVVLEEIHRHH